MTVAVVKAFEVVNIYQNKCQIAGRLRMTLVLLVQNFVKVASVSYAGQGVCDA